jgi:hypothetical protein
LTVPRKPDDENAADGERQMLIRTDPRRFLSIAAIDDEKERLSSLHWIDDILLCEIVHYGIRNDAKSIPHLWQLYPYLIENDMPVAMRRSVFEEVKGLVTGTDFVSANAILPFICSETDVALVSTSVIDFVSLAPVRDNDPMSTSLDIIAGIKANRIAKPGAAFGGLLHLGDPRLCKLLLPLRRELSFADLNEGITSVTGHLSAATIDFELSWLEEPGLDAALFGAVASGLVLQRRAAKRPFVMTGQRPFPVTSVSAEEQNAMARYLSIEEYTRAIAPRLYAIANAEQAPTIMPFVLGEWGLDPPPGETATSPSRIIH